MSRLGTVVAREDREHSLEEMLAGRGKLEADHARGLASGVRPFPRRAPP